MSKSYSGQDFPVFRISPYSVRMRENADQKNSEYGHFLRSGILTKEDSFFAGFLGNCNFLETVIFQKTLDGCT